MLLISLLETFRCPWISTWVCKYLYKVRNYSDLPVCLSVYVYITHRNYFLASIMEAKRKKMISFCEKKGSKKHCFTFSPSFQKSKSRPTISLSNVTSSLQFTTNIWACDIWEHFKMSKVFHVALRPGPWSTIMHFDKILGQNVHML